MDIKSNYLVSVVITNYNYGHFLPQCIDSVLHSNLDTSKFEIIIIDDASTDNSLVIIETYKSVNPHVSIIVIENETNIGLVRSRNRGIFHATGTYIFILDADNFIGPDCLLAHVECMLQNKDAIACYGKIQDFANKNGAYLGLRSDKTFDYISLLKAPYIDAMAMFDRQFLLDNGMYNLNMPAFGWEDYELWLRIGKMGQKVVFLEHLPPLSFYRFHENNMGTRVVNDYYNQCVYFLRTLYPLELKFKDGDVFNYLQSTRIHYAQIFYYSDQNLISEADSIILLSEKKVISARIPVQFKYTGFRFDPLNDFAITQVKSIRFFFKANEVFINYTLTSNARLIHGNLFYFDTEDPQITIEFPQIEFVEIDEIGIEYKIIERGSEALKYIIRTLHNDSQCKREHTIHEDNSSSKNRLSDIGKLKLLPRYIFSLIVGLKRKL